MRKEQHGARLWTVWRVLGCVTLAAWVCPAATVAAPLFGDPRSYAVGTSPVGLVTGEFSGTEGLDLGTVDEGNTLTLLENEGNGVFHRGARINIEDRYVATDVVAGDFNADGFTDLALSADDVQSFPGFEGAVLTFSSSAPYQYNSSSTTVAEFPTCVTLADVSRDGADDIVACATAAGAGAVSVLRGLSGGTFAMAEGVPLGSVVPRVVLVRDVDVDEFADLVALDVEDNSVWLFPGTSEGLAFSAPQRIGTVDGPYAVVVADFNGDALPDVAVSSRGTARVVVFRQTGPRTFAPGVPYTTGLLPTGLAVGLVDEDEHEDLVVANNGSDDVTVLLGNGDGTFEFQEAVPVGRGPVAIVVGDFNRDGKLDFATANQDDETFGRDMQSVSVVLNGVTPPFTPTPTRPITPSSTPTPTVPDTATPNPTMTAPIDTPTGTPSTLPACAGDCNDDGSVGINELILGVNISLGQRDVSACPAFDTSGNGSVEISELIRAVRNSLDGCSV
jgi:hypothetical protein